MCDLLSQTFLLLIDEDTLRLPLVEFDPRHSLKEREFEKLNTFKLETKFN